MLSAIICRTWWMPVFAGIVLANVASAQSAPDPQALGKDVEALKSGQATMQKELQEIKALLQQIAQPVAPTPASAGIVGNQARPSNASAGEPVDFVLAVGDAPVKGADNAKVTLVEFTDYQCPFCSRHFQQTWPQIEKDYVVTGKVKLVLRDLPLEQIHPQAMKAAEAANCAADQNKFWDMHDRLFNNQSALARPQLTAHAQALGLDVAAFDKCMDSGATTAKIRKDIAESMKAGARGTPVFFIGLTDPKSSDVKVTRIIRGAVPYATFKEAIDGVLASAK